MPKLTPTFHDNNPQPTDSAYPPILPIVADDLELHAKAREASTAPQEPQDGPNEPAPLKVAIIGTAPSSRMLAPYNDPSWQIWVCSPGNMNVVPRVDLWFELHSDLHYPENQHYGVPYLEFLRNLKCPVYAQDYYINSGQLPNAKVFPKDELVQEFGPYFFTSSFAWMIALAIHRGAKEIGLFGVDMASRDEYILQRPGAYKFFEECKRRNVRIGAPMESDILMPPPLYGFFNSTPFGRKIVARDKELKDRIGGLKAEIEKLQKQLVYLEGAVEDLDYVKNIWGGAQQFPPAVIA